MRALILAVALVLLSSKSFANDDIQEKFQAWLVNLKIELVNDHNFDHSLVEEAFEGVKFNEKVVGYDRSQPEFIRTVGNYLSLAVSKTRIRKGQRLYSELSSLYDQINDDYGVRGEFLTSFWALETNFSNYTGKIDIIEALATLIYDGRRARFFKAELLEALKVLQIENFIIPGNRLKGSWAGAMGSTQFIPSKINRYAMDYNNDGVINMWQSRPDFLGSSGRFLKGEGWKRDGRWGVEVEVSEDFDFSQANLKIKKKFSYWKELGVEILGDEEGISSDDLGALYLPQGYKGPKFIVFDNYFTIFRWNASSKYALGISVLSDLIIGRADYYHKFDLNEDNFLTFELTKKLQAKLNELGFDAGRVDGIPGSQTARAVQGYQKSRGLVADGYISKELMKNLGLL